MQSSGRFLLVVVVDFLEIGVDHVLGAGSAVASSRIARGNEARANSCRALTRERMGWVSSRVAGSFNSEDARSKLGEQGGSPRLIAKDAE